MSQQRSKISEFMGKEVYVLQVGGFFFLFVIMLVIAIDSTKETMKAQASIDGMKNKLEDAHALYVSYKNENKELEKEYQGIRNAMGIISESLGVTNPDLKAILKGITALQGKVDHFRDIINQPPIISLTSSGGFTFPTGQMVLSKSFRDRIDGDVVPKILNNSLKFGTDLVVISGHTDEVPMYEGDGEKSNFDKEIFQYVTGQKKDLRSVSNAELGLARALAVTMYLKEKPSLSHLKIVPYSGGQMVTKNNVLTKGDKKADASRRRIEIWLQRSSLSR